MYSSINMMRLLVKVALATYVIANSHFSYALMKDIYLHNCIIMVMLIAYILTQKTACTEAKLITK